MVTPTFAAFAPPLSDPTPLRAAISAATRREEAACLRPLLEAATLPDDQRRFAAATARDLIKAVRAKDRRGGMESLVQEYSLSSQEGVALMCLAEALLRIPDDGTRDALIRDKISGGDWQSHLGGGRSLFLNAATWGLVVTRRVVSTVDDSGLSKALSRLLRRAGEPVIRSGVEVAMRLMGEQFVMGETISEALKRAREKEARGFRFSYDMLGEAAATAEDARRYFVDYLRAIHAIGLSTRERGLHEGAGISIKLSALHPRYSRAQGERVMTELLPRVRELAIQSRGYGIGLNIDAEEADRLEISLDLFEALALDPALAGWDGLGFVVQAYGKRCPLVIDWLVDLAHRAGRRIMVRLVKGAYWDAEIKRAQVDGLADYPVYTRKLHSDVAYIACARKLLDHRDVLFPQFATHNAQTLASVLAMAGPDYSPEDYEFQCLHGMGEALYEEVVSRLKRPCRIYAPVGTHRTLLAYLVRRLLENGANSSFVNRIADPDVPVEDLVADPVALVRAMPEPGARNPRIALPHAIYPERENSAGIDLGDEPSLQRLAAQLQSVGRTHFEARPTTGSGLARAVCNPADHGDVVGTVHEASEAEALDAIGRAAACGWARIPVDARAAALERAADLMQARMETLMGLAMREAGKSAANAIAEVREAIDFLRYYAGQARLQLEGARPLGPVVCISPWNFPLAIFTGQVGAALAAGNAVLAKPAEETPLIAAQAVAILHEAGVPDDALQIVPGAGDIGAALVSAPETAGVMFTGSTEVARLIQQTLAARLSPEGRVIPLIAETGGQNAMIVDSSALTEQVVADVLASAFDSAGQRCSALRVLCLQEDVAERTMEMLRGALAELRVGSTDRLAVDVGPVISAEAQAGINAHIETMRAKGKRITQIPLHAQAGQGTFVAPTIIEIDALGELGREVFGPVLHVLTFRRERIDALIDEINATGYGLTFGLHTRLDATVARVTDRIEAGNVYVNRNQIGAVVGVQPFGGRGLSGTGPKAGGPLYLGRLVHDAPPVLPASPAPPDPALAALVAWLEESGLTAIAEKASGFAEASPNGLELELPGPVGERNLYRLEPRGEVLVRAASEEGLCLMLAAVLAAGCRARIDAGQDLPSGLPQAVSSRISPLGEAPVSAVLVEGDAVTVLATLAEVAAWEGPVVPVHTIQTCDPRWLVEEVSTSINTTAAGGNASLMMIG
ncbi:trifunctional transcriptional regulator/proline dehydrogenase/L-glutamate gamma-semialdehyde dehydrogenase [Novosphingobium sp. PC22D]|uniref:bifunctional proline dehydrogenase/L-glutamate gamma-semialdehyde dehydrogenase PutA n=1 Tax=Novosphingobium sp. PC22D TaxID=1962403 RepID=UPI000BEF49F5|nr:bifunctional proline dehydrogenase/L-glutamate gamma-semialdehyde dehydrogenase PutA [Novosphingobium sp. PC22D]PEQ13894.1 trifunctional transcriptional regulator/proline dehydrogenase/L-glutamate gamma-semialdehyde dehydrogenase [Novosphingobium sp. PC22D]